MEKILVYYLGNYTFNSVMEGNEILFHHNFLILDIPMCYSNNKN